MHMCGIRIEWRKRCNQSKQGQNMGRGGGGGGGMIFRQFS